mgnify:FL=1
MYTLDVSQANDTEAWLEARRGKITGTKSGKLVYDTYRNSERLKTSIEFWKYAAENYAIEPDGENPMERGHRLENQNATITLTKLGINPETAEYDTGLWVSDTDERIAVSPDVCEKGDKPTWAIECKSLGSAYHLQTVMTYRIWKLLKPQPTPDLEAFAVRWLDPITTSADSIPFDFIPKQYQPQVLQYFVVNENLKTLYFSLYDDRVYGDLCHEYIPVTRDSIGQRITAHKGRELATLDAIDTLTQTFSLSF